jgi:hypothetical protein
MIAEERLKGEELLERRICADRMAPSRRKTRYATKILASNNSLCAVDKGHEESFPLSLNTRQSFES